MKSQILLQKEGKTYGAFVELFEDGKVRAGEAKTSARWFESAEEALCFYRPLAVGMARGPQHITECLQDLLDQKNDGR